MKTIKSNFPLILENKSDCIDFIPLAFNFSTASEFMSTARMFFPWIPAFNAVSVRIPEPVPISKILIFLSFLVTIYAYFFQNNMIILAGIFAWIAFLFLFSTLKNKILIIILLLFSLLAYIIVLVNNFEINFIKIFTVNQYLLTLLIGVGFLRLIAMPKKDKTSSLPKGKNSFIKTYLSVHLFGSVINLSSLILVADKMYKKAPLSKSQIILLTRAFSSDAYWSPFFVAFAAAITYAPKLNSSVIVINGIILAFIAFIIT